jgi:anti-sigma-K factor RskA
VNSLASYDPASGYLQVIPVAAGACGEKSLELWLLLQKGNPVSLGIFKPGKQGELTIPLELRDDITAGTTLAVSLEPFGGSPTGVPSGPIVVSGIVRPL